MRLTGRGKFLMKVLINWYTIVDLDLYRPAHEVQLDPVFAWFSKLRHAIFLWKYLLPNGFPSIYICKPSLLDDLQLWANPNCLFAHIFCDADVIHLYIAYLLRTVLLGLLLFAFLLVFGCFLGLLLLHLQSGMHFFFSLQPEISIYHNRRFFVSCLNILVTKADLMTWLFLDAICSMFWLVI